MSRKTKDMPAAFSFLDSLLLFIICYNFRLAILYLSNTLNIGSKISTLRKEKRWWQGDLAQKIDASREIIGKYERNKNLPSIEMVAKMAKAFGVTADFLIGVTVLCHRKYFLRFSKTHYQVQRNIILFT